ncbi:ABC transporter permease [Nocardiopsis ansamitocini]|uniref:Sulfate ABC transporter permease n=1 Tax=Nocardiopsis ansamitocini TaxID=1670832 RepID=A0A9W6P4F6_9ACTN|nr:ABC transporter permease subunit [Nocardiopsis ansamitocini]GLU46882.1 sulfate ABC transporter permease [Nocardiopsis ansamitocini]
MPLDSATTAQQRADARTGQDEREVAGLDALELGPQRLVEPNGFAVWGKRLWDASWPKALALVLVLGAWQAVVWSEWKPEFVFPGPDKVLPVLLGEVTTPRFWEAMQVTMQRALSGFALAVVVGVLVGVAVSRIKPLRAAIGSLITGLQTMPSIVWFPFAMLLYGITESAIMFVIILGAAPSIANGLVSGIDYVSPNLLRVGQVVGLRGIARYRYLIVPAALPTFVAGLKQGWAFAWRSLMAGELLVIIDQQNSIGWALSQARTMNNSERLLSYILIVLIIGIVIDIFFSYADKSIRKRWGIST